MKRSKQLEKKPTGKIDERFSLTLFCLFRVPRGESRDFQSWLCVQTAGTWVNCANRKSGKDIFGERRYFIK